ncbi:hypothetical protein PM082_002600 [Marasmius tenuissimus]|nr:hypothetical protein PM082_002600 [Marasmius tenuissimus]
MNSFAQFLKEDDERFYETFPEARAAKEAARTVHLHQPSAHYGQHWTSQQLGEDYGPFGGGYVFYYADNEAPSANPPGNCFLEHSTPQPEAHPCAIDPAHSPQASYSHPFPHQVYEHRQPDITNQHDAESLYSIGDSVPSADVNNQSQDYAPVPVVPYPDNSMQRHDVVSSPVESAPTFASPQAQEQPQQNVHYNQTLQPAVPAVETPAVDYLPSPESPQSIYSPVDTANSHQHFSADPALGVEPVLVPSSQPITTSSPNPPPAFFPAEGPRVIADLPSPTTSTFTKTLSVRKRRRTESDEHPPPPPEAGRSYVYKIPLTKPNHNPPKVQKRRPTTPQSNEKKNLALACFFCRGRKIACGPHDPTSSDRTCGQCHRRSLKCEYPTESRRGMRKKKGSVVEFPPGSEDQQQDLGTLGPEQPQVTS